MLGGAASAEGAISAGVYKDGKLLIEEPAANDTSPPPATKDKTDSKDGESKSGKHRGESIDSGEEGG